MQPTLLQNTTLKSTCNLFTLFVEYGVLEAQKNLTILCDGDVTKEDLQAKHSQ